MGIFEVALLREALGDDFNNFKVVVETGTCLGYSTGILSEVFREVYTIELDQALYERAKMFFAGKPNVKCIQGDSKVVLDDMISSKLIREPAVFFLDAHFSGNRNTDWNNSLWKGYPGIETSFAGEEPTPSNQVPLDKELQIINDTFPYRCIIYIDDMDKFDDKGQGKKDKGFKGEDWSHLTVKMLISIVAGRVLRLHKLGECQLIMVLDEIR